MPTWPAIRKPLRNGWRGSAPDGVRVSPMDAGPPKRRVESRRAAAMETLQFKLSDADAATLDAFYLANKAAMIDYTHPVWGAVQVAFARAPSWGEDGIWRIATVELEVYR